MRVVVPGFEHREGIHCGSSAMADALRHLGLAMSEESALGLGAGPSFILFERLPSSPSHFFLGRSVSYEADLCRLLGVRFDERSVADFDEAWRELRALLRDGRPVLALTDLRYLPHYGTSTHFNGHRVVVAGYDDAAGTVLVADSHFPGLTAVPLDAFRAAMTSDAPPLPSTDSIFGHLEKTGPLPDPRDVVPRAIRLNAEEMLAPAGSVGIEGIERLASHLPRWGDAGDWQFCARFSSQVIEKRGCGGGLFRRMYERFLREAAASCAEPRYVGLAELSRASADAWSALAAELRAASMRAVPELSRAASLAGTVADAERRLWEGALAVSR